MVLTPREPELSYIYCSGGEKLGRIQYENPARNCSSNSCLFLSLVAWYPVRTRWLFIFCDGGRTAQSALLHRRSSVKEWLSDGDSADADMLGFSVEGTKRTLEIITVCSALPFFFWRSRPIWTMHIVIRLSNDHSLLYLHKETRWSWVEYDMYIQISYLHNFSIFLLLISILMSVIFMQSDGQCSYSKCVQIKNDLWGTRQKMVTAWKSVFGTSNFVCWAYYSVLPGVALIPFCRFRSCYKCKCKRFSTCFVYF